MGKYVLDFPAIDKNQIALVGGKGANLGELSRIRNIRVPAGFCVTTVAFNRIIADALSLESGIDALSRLRSDDHDGIRALSADLRRTIENIAVPDDFTTEITHALLALGDHACAVRSSATAEDLPTASFAGQQDTYLNVVGPAAVVLHIRRCWASLFTERAVTYRMKNGVDHRRVSMGVVVQRMVSPRAAGVLFTADPITGNRNVASVEATIGLGEALVSGLVNADLYKVRDDVVVAKTPARPTQPALTDEHVVKLVRLAREIESHFGAPQDIEWCLTDDDFQFVQSRPITTLFPIPASADEAHHVYVSVGHQQMMTDAMTPLGISVWQLTAMAPMHTAGGRLFVDVTHALSSPAGRAGLLAVMGRGDPLYRDALETVIDRDFIPLRTDGNGGSSPRGSTLTPIETDPAIVDELIARAEASIAILKREIATKSGSALLEFILSDVDDPKRNVFSPLSVQAIMAGMEATWWLNDQLLAWLGEKNAADALAQSVPNNVTSEMGLALLDVADVVRRHPDVVAFLQRVDREDFLDDLAAIAGGRDVRDALQAWLAKYGMRCPGEIDITRPRWSECPTMLVPVILNNVRHFDPGAAERRFEKGLEHSRNKELELLERLRVLPDGAQKTEEVKRQIDRLRTFNGYREYPKYGLICRYFVYKEALMREAERLVEARVLREKEDVFHLTFQELQDVVRTKRVDDGLIAQRKDAFKSYQSLRPPRVLTSEGECVTGDYRRTDFPAGALVGLPVSAGLVEGRARVILDMATADLEKGDILVTAFTDPSWTPLFVAINGLVTEVGGSMTHGAVIAREYGVPAVVGVERATQLIRDGQRIRVHGTEGYVEII